MNSQKPEDREEGLATQGSDPRFYQDPEEAEATFPSAFSFP
jgi:hypothetical protein